MYETRIVVVEDEEPIMDIVSQTLRKNGYDVVKCYDGDEAMEVIENVKPTLILLDLMLPGIDGWEICRRIRGTAELKSTPIIMMTARRDEVDVVEGLNIGADDYIKKPFSLRELEARVKAQLRRVNRENQTNILEVGSLKLNISEDTATIEGEEMGLSITELKLLKLLMERCGHVVSRSKLLSIIWGLYGEDSRTIDVHISRLRKKLNSADDRISITAVRGRGYRISVKEVKDEKP